MCWSLTLRWLVFKTQAFVYVQDAVLICKLFWGTDKICFHYLRKHHRVLILQKSALSRSLLFYEIQKKKKGDLPQIGHLRQVRKLSANATNILLEYQGTASILSSYFSTSLIFIIGLSFTAIN